MDSGDLRPFTESDTEAVVDLSLRAWEPVFASFEQVWGKPIFERFYPDWRSHQADSVRHALEANETWVTVDGASVTGFVNIVCDTDEKSGQVYMIAVDPDSQRDGLGTRLMEHALGVMRQRNLTLATVGTGGDPGHLPARLLYESVGFKPFPQVLYSMLLSPES